MAGDKPEAVDVERIKRALVTAGVLKSATLDRADESRLEEALGRHQVDKPSLSFKIICHSNHYCIVVRGVN